MEISAANVIQLTCYEKRKNSFFCLIKDQINHPRVSFNKAKWD